MRLLPCVLAIATACPANRLHAEAPPPDLGHQSATLGSKVTTSESPHVDRSLFARDNLFAWCIVPFDGKKRGPEARAAMLERLGIHLFAYDYRAEHIPTFDAELAALKRHHIRLIAWWFPTTLNAEARHILDVLKRHRVHTQLWVTGSGGPVHSDAQRQRRIDAEAARIRPIAQAAAAIGCTVALYNHGGWFGKPENQLAIIRRLRLPNVGIVYNLHHGHADIDRFPELLRAIKPHLLAISLNGMNRLGESLAKKHRSKNGAGGLPSPIETAVRSNAVTGSTILPIGAGQYDRPLLRAILESGWRGPVGILNHTDYDAESRLRDNLDGLAWIVKQLAGRPAGPRPTYRTYPTAATGDATAAVALRGGMLAAGRAVYRSPPITVDCRVTLVRRDRYNILVACDTKRSGSHWEIFSMPGSGALTAYLPGMRPDHVRSTANLADGKPHHVSLVYQRNRVRLYVDGRPVADTPVASTSQPTIPGDLGLGRLVEGGLTCSGRIESVRLRSGVHLPPAPPAQGTLQPDQNASTTRAGSSPRPDNDAARSRIAAGTKTAPHPPSGAAAKSPPADSATVGLWRFGSVVDRQVRDLSPLDNPARMVASAPTTVAPTMPPPGPHLRSTDPRLHVVLINRSRDDVYMAVKADGTGRLFVGGRTSVFVFEPDQQGGYGPKERLFRFPEDSIIIGLELRGNDLYVQTGTALYVLPEGRVRRTGLRPYRLLWGLPRDLHVSFHCLAWGPAGNLYLNHGDPLLQFGDWDRPDHWGHWTLHTYRRTCAASRDGRPPSGSAKAADADAPVDRRSESKQPYTGSGAVLRMRPDGSDLRVLARGLRGPVGLVFDPAWDLFTNDNDHESLPDRYLPARLLHVTPHIDFGWPRGWMASKHRSRPIPATPTRPANDADRRGFDTSVGNLDRADLIEPMTDQLGPGVPCGMAFYDEPYLPAEDRGRLLLCRWGRATVTSYRLTHRGSTFDAAESVLLKGSHNARPTGICVGRGGRLFVTCLYLPGNVASPHCPSDLVMITRADDVPAHRFAAVDVVRASDAQLWDQLSHDSWEQRRTAHLELLRRGTATVRDAGRRLARTSPDDPAFSHLIWLTAASGVRTAARQLVPLTRHPRAEVRFQAIRAVNEFCAGADLAGTFRRALDDPDPRIELVGLHHFLDRADPLPFDRVAQLASSSDSYLRQTASLLLARRGSEADLAGLLASQSAARRLAGVLALGTRLTVPPANDVPPTNVRLTLPSENAFFKRSLHFADPPQLVDVAKTDRVGSYTTAARWRATRPDARDRWAFAQLVRRLDDGSSVVRLQAAYDLSLLDDPRSEPRVALARRRSLLEKLAPRPLRTIERAWVLGPLPNVLPGGGQASPNVTASIDLTAVYDVGRSQRRSPDQAGSLPGPENESVGSDHRTGAKIAWRQIGAEGGDFSWAVTGRSPPAQTHYVYFRLQSRARQQAMLTVDTPAAYQVWHQGRSIRPIVAGKNGFLVDLRAGSNDIVIRTRTVRPGTALRVTYRTAEGAAATLPEKLDSGLLAKRLRQSANRQGAGSVAQAFAGRDWNSEVRTGNAQQGRHLFGTLGCVKCHAVTAGQPGGGAPNLSEAGRRFTIAHLVESILLPNSRVADPFRTTVLVTGQGTSLQGLVVGETQQYVDLLCPDTTRKRVARDTIEARRLSPLSPMPVGLVKTPEELRDLLAYLVSPRPLPP